MDINWTIAGPMVLTVLANICAFAYVFGVTNQKLLGVDRDVERIRIDVERLHEQNRDTDNRIHEIAIMLTKVSTQLDQLMGNDPDNCPIIRLDSQGRKHVGGVEAEGGHK